MNKKNFPLIITIISIFFAGIGDSYYKIFISNDTYIQIIKLFLIVMGLFAGVLPLFSMLVIGSKGWICELMVKSIYDTFFNGYTDKTKKYYRYRVICYKCLEKDSTVLWYKTMKQGISMSLKKLFFIKYIEAEKMKDSKSYLISYRSYCNDNGTIIKKGKVNIPFIVSSSNPGGFAGQLFKGNEDILYKINCPNINSELEKLMKHPVIKHYNPQMEEDVETSIDFFKEYVFCNYNKMTQDEKDSIEKYMKETM